MTQREVFWEVEVQGEPLGPPLYATNANAPGWTQGILGEAIRTVNSNQFRSVLYVAEDGLDITDGEVAAEIRETRLSSPGISGGVVVRANDGNHSAFSGYIATLSSAPEFSLSISRYVNGSYTFGIAEAPNTKGLNASDGFNVRLRAEGVNLMARFWERGTPEPDTWDLTVVDTNLTAGAFGIFCGNIGTYRFGKMSIGYGGDAAPPVEYRISGKVTDHDDSPMGRTVRAYERVKGNLQGETSSDPVTGGFGLYVKKVTAEHYVVVLDEEPSDRNALIKDRVLPYAG